MYTSIKRLLAAGLIEEYQTRGTSVIYQLTEFGREILTAEVARYRHITALFDLTWEE